ncbi:hypothetical protein N7468_008255 [Penicillium chermesinum]|uniref:Uncharacterized protein n=1 Tax=Penicillium chermesinum TaxID=63820 RepID=A0A9W9TIA0_9EURO|nr:uncharacterized protein N7468_008255 [Penicillium chermesinum]KAJ5223713.1 hypothetical protein N7468_008255 [Penicillium chermesinum]
MISISAIARPCVRHFSAQRPRPSSRTERAVVTACLVSGVVLPFVPPAMASSRQRKSGNPSSKG